MSACWRWVSWGARILCVRSINISWRVLSCWWTHTADLGTKSGKATDKISDLQVRLQFFEGELDNTVWMRLSGPKTGCFFSIVDGCLVDHGYESSSAGRLIQLNERDWQTPPTAVAAFWFAKMLAVGGENDGTEIRHTWFKLESKVGHNNKCGPGVWSP